MIPRAAGRSVLFFRHFSPLAVGAAEREKPFPQIFCLKNIQFVLFYFKNTNCQFGSSNFATRQPVSVGSNRTMVALAVSGV